MVKPDKLWKTTIVIWTDLNPTNMELDDLAREAVNGCALCQSQETVEVTDKDEMPDTDFFGDGEG